MLRAFGPVGGHRLSTNLSHLFSHFSYTLLQVSSYLINGQGDGLEFIVAADHNEDNVINNIVPLIRSRKTFALGVLVDWLLIKDKLNFVCLASLESVVTARFH